MDAVITGGTGFIGSHLAQALVHTGIRVALIDQHPPSPEHSLVSLCEQKQCFFVPADIRIPGLWQEIFQGVSWVFHLAGVVLSSQEHSSLSCYEATHVAGTRHVLEAAHRGGVKKFVYAASASCYGLHPKLPLSEAAPLAPHSCYARTKQQGEALALQWGAEHSLPVVSLRLFNVYSTAANDINIQKGVVARFLAQKRLGLPYSLRGDGRQRRDFIHVSDVVRAFLQAAVTEACGEVFNVGTGIPTSLSTLVSYLGGSGIYLPPLAVEPRESWAAIEKITQHLDWKPRISLEAALAPWREEREASPVEPPKLFLPGYFGCIRDAHTHKDTTCREQHR